MYLIVGNFFGIQDYIFSNLKSKKSASILRGRSFDIYGLMNQISNNILKELQLDEENLLFLNSGKFYIKVDEKVELEESQKKIDEYFLKNYFTNSGVSLFCIDFQENDFQATLKNINVQKEIMSFQKFSLWNMEDPLIDRDFKKSAQEYGICDQCEKRVREKESSFCSSCNNHATIGEDLRSKFYLKVGDNFNYELTDKKTDLNIEKYIPYVPKKGEKIKAFDEIADNSQNLMIALKADIDNLGNSFASCENLEEFLILSKELDDFMTDKIKKLIDGKNIYTIFSGGDDLFLIGEFNAMIKFVELFKGEFDQFAQKNLNGSTITIALEMIKQSTPIKFISDKLELNIKSAKSKRDSLYIFDEIIPFNKYKIFEDYQNELEKYGKSFVLKTAFYYRLLELTRSRIDLTTDKKNFIENSMWQSKLSYFFKRNIIDKQKRNKELGLKFMEYIYKQIEYNPNTFLVFLKISIYQRRMEENE